MDQINGEPIRDKVQIRQANEKAVIEMKNKRKYKS